MAASKAERAMDALEKAMPKLLEDRGFNPDSCILATRVAILALGEFGIKATPIVCRVDILNAAYAKAMREGRLEPGSLTDADAKVLQEEGCWALCIGDPRHEGVLRPDGRRGFNGHVVALVERKWVLDLTIHQASRPNKDINLEPHHFEAPSGFIHGYEPLVGRDESVWLRYQRIANQRFLQAPDWVQVRRDLWEVRTAVEVLRLALSGRRAA